MTPHEKAVEAAELVRAFAELADCGVPSDVQELLMHGNPTLCVQPNALARALLAYGQSRADEATERAAQVAVGVFNQATVSIRDENSPEQQGFDTFLENGEG